MEKLNTIEINFSEAGFVYIRMKAFLLEVTLHRMFIFPFIWDNDRFFVDVLVMQPLS